MGQTVSQIEAKYGKSTSTTQLKRLAKRHNVRLTVIRGDNLWNIARAHYGEGLRYTVIFEANKGQIRDPDLIYPGQVFSIPKVN